jgi:hypothetical protein
VPFNKRTPLHSAPYRARTIQERRPPPRVIWPKRYDGDAFGNGGRPQRSAPPTASRLYPRNTGPPCRTASAANHT